MATPLVADIKRNSLDDGPGIRSVVFFKGCPLRCVWCHNPECIDPGPEILFRPEKCIGCGSCAEVCDEGAIGAGGPASLDRQVCTLCGACTDECPGGALTLVGRSYTVEELAETLARDKAFYDNSGGGVTLSGGEPTLFMDYAGALAAELQARGIRVLIETCSEFPWPAFDKKLLPHIDEVYTDFKLFEEDLHQRYTGRSNKRIRQNIEKMIDLPDLKVLVRVPLIPGVTATEENLTSIARWMRSRGLARTALLPYNPLWLSKARGLGKSLHYDRDSWMTEEERSGVRRIFEGLELARDI